MECPSISLLAYVNVSGVNSGVAATERQETFALLPRQWGQAEGFRGMIPDMASPFGEHSQGYLALDVPIFAGVDHDLWFRLQSIGVSAAACRIVNW